MLKIIEDLNEWKQTRNHLLDNRLDIGFVPTMGALHKGHLSLIKKAQQANDLCVVSIYVNPTQFNNESDLKTYPVTLNEDIEKLKALGVSYVLLPTFDQIYPDNFTYKVSENDFSKKLCGESRLGHFDGVLTVVMKLLNIVQPKRAYFGQKDYQQYLLIKKMTEAFFMDVEIIAGETIREDDGLALSSRNMHLNNDQRKIAPKFNELLQSDLNISEVKKALEEHFKVDYIEEIDGKRYGAVYLGKTRIIDNV